MAAVKTDITQFLQLAQQYLVLDVRSPAEYKHAHIPGAHSLPLFSDEERKEVGTLYKQEGRQPAIKKGMDIFGPKMRGMVEEVETLIKGKVQHDNIVLVHCWRGGMRSGTVAWLLDLYGFKVHTLVGGYKRFRNWALEQFEQQYQFNILGGRTGSGKTVVVQKMLENNWPVIDLEGIAHHKGSAFGALGQLPQPSQEMFENKLALKLHASRSEEIWLEDESQRVGVNMIPKNIWIQMRAATIYFLDISYEERLKHIMAEYGIFKKDQLVNATMRIQKRLGGLETKNAINLLLEDNVEGCFRILLNYYDRLYQKGLESRENLQELLLTVPCETVTADNLYQLEKSKHVA